MKKIGLLFATVVMMILFAFSASALEPTGQCGDNVYWSFDESTGELVISGEGEMWDYGHTAEHSGYSPFRKTDIKSVVIEEGITKLCEGAFEGCIKLKSVKLPSGITRLIPNTFLSCIILENFEVNENNPSYCNDEYGVLYNKDKTELVQYPVGNKRTTYVVASTVKNIGYSAFENSFYLEKVILPEGLTTIDNRAFNFCVSLKELILPKSLTSIGELSICWCVSLKELNIPELLVITDNGIPSISSCYFMDKIYIESMNCKTENLEYYINFPASFHKINGLSQDRAVELAKDIVIELITGEDLGASLEFESYIEFVDEDKHYEALISTLYCHQGSTVEDYAKKNNLKYVFTHFYENDWIYDYENMIRFRKCKVCNEIETEKLQIENTNPDHPPKEEFNFFEMIIEWIKNLFEIILGWFKK